MSKLYWRFKMWIALSRFGVSYYTAIRKASVARKVVVRNIMMRNHIHEAGDDRGARDVTLDGKQIEDVFFADTKKGIVRQHARGDDGRVVFTEDRKSLKSVESRGHVVVTKKGKR